MTLRFEVIKRTDINLNHRMRNHYSNPKGFVGRNICYSIYYNNIYYGNIVGGSCCMNLPNRNEFFEIDKSQYNNIVNNIFYNISIPVNELKYPLRNFTSFVLKNWIDIIIKDWEIKYGDKVIGIETLVEPPRDGLLYKKIGFKEIGITKGYTCKRIKGKESGKYSGKRVWDYKNLRPKIVLAYKIGI